MTYRDPTCSERVGLGGGDSGSKSITSQRGRLVRHTCVCGRDGTYESWEGTSAEESETVQSVT
ncbi:hypothetical protein QJS04_geneDACA002069 [Acorus gramineus]|uniref:Uncharacterized protein n=1 Tax=Acorus gramineus TaxID=55184 RepID=A0AAV9A7X4_ACOGR|nr:hypothetical protein QJS04_geneDACA002069 [Acorus gramineus]